MRKEQGQGLGDTSLSESPELRYMVVALEEDMAAKAGEELRSLKRTRSFGPQCW